MTTTLLVLDSDLSTYFSMQYINQLPARIIPAMYGTISVTLNVKYLLDWKPPGIFGMIIAVSVDMLIPLMLCLFGLLDNAIRESNGQVDSNGYLPHVVKFHLEKYPDLSNREISNLVGCSHMTVRKYLLNHQ